MFLDHVEQPLALGRPPRTSGGVPARRDKTRRDETSSPHERGCSPIRERVREIAIDALDIDAVRPFWLAVLGYRPFGGDGDLTILDPRGRGPALWFQQMDEPRPQRNRIHLDVAVPHDEAEDRLTAALAAGGVLVSDARARAFWVLADTEGNEVCITTWQDRG